MSLRCPRPRPRHLAAPRSSVSAPLRPARRPNALRAAQLINLDNKKSVKMIIGMHFFRKISTTIIFSAVIFAEVIMHANAVVMKPQRSGSDGRFKYWTYQKNGVYYYEGYYMHPSYIQFNPGERLQSIYLPKPSSWSMKRSENRLFLMPVEEDAETTMTVMTTERAYFFELHARTATGPFDPDVTFVTRFRYNSAGGGGNSADGSDENTIIAYAFRLFVFQLQKRFVHRVAFRHAYHLDFGRRNGL